MQRNCFYNFIYCFTYAILVQWINNDFNIIKNETCYFNIWTILFILIK